MAHFRHHNYTICRCYLQCARTATIVDTMIEREITGRLTSLFRQYPFVTVTGPRQSGKTTLCRAAFPNLEYANLEAPDQREFAETDPRGFLSQFTSGAILDEIQRVPALLSYLQVLADESGHNSLFVLTGSEQFQLSDAISQSLAGRTALLRLLPLSLAERERAGASNSVDEIIYSGFYPRIIDQMLNPRQALADYFETYVERDLRRLGEVRNLASFRRFVRLCAGRVGQLINLTSLGSDVGVSHTTAREWLTILEMSYIVFQLPPFHANIRKRLIRSSKLYFHDVGLASYLIGIEHVDQVATHPLRGSLFENVVVTEALKHRFNRGRQFNLSFFRDAQGLECDLLYETGRGVVAIEAKSGSTIASDYFTSLNRVAELIPAISAKAVVYAGPTRQSRSDCEVIPLGEFRGMLERLEVSQEAVAFLRDRMGPAPDDFDLETLDTVYRTHIRPTLEGLESICRPLADQLFRHVYPSFTVNHGQSRVQIGGLLEARKWERTKNQHIVTPGFRLNDAPPLELKHIYRFQGYTGRGRNEFNINLAVEWQLGSEGFSRRVTLDEESISELQDTFSYSDLDTRSGEADRVAAEITASVMRKIDRLSSG